MTELEILLCIFKKWLGFRNVGHVKTCGGCMDKKKPLLPFSPWDSVCLFVKSSFML